MVDLATLQVAVLSNPCRPYSCPLMDICAGILGLLLGPVGTFSIFLMTSSPSSTRPNTTCLPSRNSHLAHVTKNWQPLESLPEFAMDSSHGASCFSLKFSSSNTQYSRPVTTLKVSSLYHEIFNDPVKAAVFIPGGHPVATILSRTELTEVLTSPGYHVRVELHNQPPDLRGAHLNVKEHHRVIR